MGQKVKKAPLFPSLEAAVLFSWEPMRAQARILLIEEGYYEAVELRERNRRLRTGSGPGDPRRRYIPGGMSDVYCCFFADRMRYMLPETLRGGRK